MLSQLPDFVCIDIVRGFFVTEKKAALLREDMVKKLVDSHHNYYTGEAREGERVVESTGACRNDACLGMASK